MNKSKWRRYIPIWLKNFFESLRNVFRWLPVIWKDKDWDDYYIFEVLKFKLKNQAEYIGYHDRHISAKRDAQIMMTCVRLIEKIQSEYYETEYLDYREANLKFVETKDGSDIFEMVIENLSEKYDDYFKKYPRIYKQVKTKDKDATAFKISKINGERALKLLFKILKENIRKWWD